MSQLSEDSLSNQKNGLFKDEIEQKIGNHEKESRNAYYNNLHIVSYSAISTILICLGFGIWMTLKRTADLEKEITERKEYEKKLFESENRFRTLIEQSPICISMIRNCNYLYSNQTHCMTFGFDSPDEIIGMTLEERIAPESRGKLAENARLLESGEIKSMQFETIGVRKDGSHFPYLVSASQLILSDGPVTLSFGTDISERQQGQELMIQSAKMSMIAGMAAGMDKATFFL